MNNLIGTEAIDFTSKAIMSDNSIEDLNLRKFTKGCKAVLFFYPLDFTFVCPSEIIACNNRIGNFTDKKTKLIGISVDSHFSHLAWKKTSPNKGGIGNIKFPLVSDLNKIIGNSYGVMSAGGTSFRGTIIIDENFIIRHVSINDFPLGRNVDEILRIIDAIDFNKEHGEACPAGWQKGQEGMVQTQDGVADYLASHSDKL
jgi:peroxiredoxin (alkyl hydroperoxide reductase subunit C)